MKQDIMTSGFIILPEQKLIMENISGLLTINNITSHRKLLYNHTNFSPDYNFLLDLRDAKIDITMEQFNAYINHLSSKGNIFKKRKSAFLVKNANQMVFANEFKKFEGKIPVETNIFTKLDDAIEWLDLKKWKDIILTHNFRLKSEPEYLWQNDSDSVSGF